MLHGRISLHDIKDVEAFCADILRRVETDLDHHQREELLAYLVSETWILSEEHRPGTAAFSTRCGNMLRRRVIDWQRQRFGRTRWQFRDRVYERPRVTVLSLDAHIGRDGELGRTLGEEQMDATPDRSPDLCRILGEGDSKDARRDGGVG